ncbi:MAG: GDP-L-fucose synthase [Desulfobacterales bacterium]|jgi:GDP-L-fucose synthase|nr:GDP-L-fucose synthase [Desulfobacteraceae bacterium]MBT4363872.1 GDP-L-fucose synthase [Desulfobacteraceae bacterium]MBT7086607.1 GDP-L-fucose synthase [Desulfobacterales bacterium]MBT7696810.1 GDP-L-fucose synthase [Desulfobacterales bacterium]
MSYKSKIDRNIPEYNSRIYVAGHRGLVGSSILDKLRAEGYTNILTRSHSELDLMDQEKVKFFFEKEKPEFVFLAAARVGGILANNTYPADFIYENLVIQNNIIHQSFINDVQKLIFLGSSCIYPKLCHQPMREEYIMTGPLEPTNSPYATAKIAGIEMCWSYNRQYDTQFFPVMPTNLYGPNDNFDLNDSHVLPALIRKFHEAKIVEAESVIVWGSGKPKREFLYVDDLADACVFILKLPYDKINSTLHSGSNFLINIGTGKEISINELAEIIAKIIGFEGRIDYDISKPDGTPRKLLDVKKINSLGWNAKTGLKEGIQKTYKWYLNSVQST